MNELIFVFKVCGSRCEFLPDKQLDLVTSLFWYCQTTVNGADYYYYADMAVDVPYDGGEIVPVQQLSDADYDNWLMKFLPFDVQTAAKISLVNLVEIDSQTSS